jgi:hypothetical protein
VHHLVELPCCASRWEQCTHGEDVW